MRFITVLATSALLVTGASAADAATDVVVNGGFEATPTSSYIYPNATVDSWTYVGGGNPGAGIINGTGGTAWFGSDPSTGFGGAQYAFVQSTGTLSQTFTAAKSGKFALSWLEGSRPVSYGGCCNGDQKYTVSLNGAVLGSFATVSAQDFVAGGASGAVVAGQSYTISFKGLSPSDNTAFIDNVSGAVVPEPATWSLLLAGFGMIGFALRRRGGAAVTA